MSLNFLPPTNALHSIRFPQNININHSFGTSSTIQQLTFFIYSFNNQMDYFYFLLCNLDVCVIGCLLS